MHKQDWKLMDYRLRKLGFSSYRKYTSSVKWKKKREDYSKSKLPQCCIICGHKEYHLHHHTYQRLGNEKLTDLVPLCGFHHQKVHDYIERKNGKISDTIDIIKKEYYFTEEEIEQKLKPFMHLPPGPMKLDNLPIDLIYKMQKRAEMISYIPFWEYFYSNRD